MLAAVLRLSTLGLQSFWFDEAFTPLHVLHPSLVTTLEWVPKTENTPPLWYLIEWFDYRLLGNGEFALRLPSAIAGIALVPGRLADRRGALRSRRRDRVRRARGRQAAVRLVLAGGARLRPVHVHDRPGDARVRARAARADAGRRLAWFWLAGSLMLLTHYFGVFVLAGMALWLLADPRTAQALAAGAGRVRGRSRSRWCR